MSSNPNTNGPMVHEGWGSLETSFVGPPMKLPPAFPVKILASAVIYTCMLLTLRSAAQPCQRTTRTNCSAPPRPAPPRAAQNRSNKNKTSQEQVRTIRAPAFLACGRRCVPASQTKRTFLARRCCGSSLFSRVAVGQFGFETHAVFPWFPSLRPNPLLPNTVGE